MRVLSRLIGHGVLADLVWTLVIARWRIKEYVPLRRKGALPWCGHYDRKMESKSPEPLAPHTQFFHTHFATTTWPSHSNALTTHKLLKLLNHKHTRLATVNDTHTRPILSSHLRLRSRTQLSALKSFNLNLIGASSILSDQRV